MPGNVAVADQHGHVGGQALGPERGRSEVGGHREKDDRAALHGGEDRGLLTAGDVDTHDGEIGRAAHGRDGVGEPDGVASVGDDDVGRQAGALKERRLGLVPDHRYPTGSTGISSSGEGQRPGLARSPEHDD